MFKRIIPFVIIVAGLFILAGCQLGTKNESQKEIEYPGIIPADAKLEPNMKMVDERLGIYTPFKLTADISHLSDSQKKMLSILFDAADIMNELYWKQTIGQKRLFLEKISNEDAEKFAMINYGPWDRLNANVPFFKGVGVKPAGANFYPPDMSKEEFEAFDDPDKTSLYTLIRRNKDGSLRSVWYHEAYAPKLKKAAVLLLEAAALAEDEGLKQYLTLRADALLTSDYLPSDFAWMDMKSSAIDFVVGPIENYEDGLFGYKAAFESFILIKDQEWSKKLAKYAAMLPGLQKGLPVKKAYKKEMPGTDADLNAYDVIYYAGDCNAGSKTIAINLPNDEEVHLKKGSRKLQLKNAMKAKFDKILIPITGILIHESQREHVTFNAFFSNTMFHEVSHAMGIKNTVNGKGSARKALKEQYSAIEEGKADIMGLYLVTRLFEAGQLKEGELMDYYVTFIAGIFRSSRFGAASAHGKANMMRFNYFKEYGAFTRTDDGTYLIDFEKTKEAMVTLMQKILYIQGDGDYEAAKAWVLEQGRIMPDLQMDLNRLNDANIPVDIIFVQGKQKMGLE